jgi:hypothetical protein
MQNSTGDPQKTAPCGGGAPTGMVTTVPVGGMLTLTLAETISHGGHYYVAIAPNVAMLPAAPTVNDINCNGLAPSQNPQLPILADGLFVQLTPAMGAQTVMVQLPAGMECPNCVVQVVEYMTQHAQPCFYYHCATVNVSNSTPPPDAGVTPGQEAGPGPGPGPGDTTTAGCCSAQGGRSSSLLLALAIGLLVLRRRRS